MKRIQITGVTKQDLTKPIIGYAVCRQWRNNPNDVEVYDYADDKQDAKDQIKELKKSDEYKWFVGVYQ